MMRQFLVSKHVVTKIVCNVAFGDQIYVVCLSREIPFFHTIFGVGSYDTYSDLYDLFLVSTDWNEPSDNDRGV